MRKLPKHIKEKANKFNLILKNRLPKYYSPFEIELNFIVGRNGNSFIFFDAILMHFAFYHVLEKEYFNLSVDFDERLYIGIPIQKKYFYFENGYREYFYLSGGIFDIPNKICFSTKRTEEPILNIVKERRVRINSGNFKNFKKPILYSTNKKYKIKGIGDIEMIEKILYNNLNIGKKTSIGFGECKFKIKQINKLELFDNATKHYIRPLPCEYIRQKHLPPIGNKIINPIRPPYFGINSKEYECFL